MTLSGQEFDALLRALHPDRAAAGEEYEKLRSRLVAFFRWEGCAAAEDWADEVINRVARRVAKGEAIRNLPAFVSGVARLAAREAGRRQARESGNLIEMPAPAGAHAAADEHPAKCLDQCLNALDGDARDLILRYYDGDAEARIRNRKALAAELGISLNSLRNRALRLRDRLESCVGNCLEDDSRDISGFKDTR